MLIGEGVHPDSGLPYVDQRLPDGTVERRWLTALPTPADHKMMAMPGWESATGIPVIPRSQWPSLQFHRPHTTVPILDQNGQGACVGYAGTGAGMILRDRQGMTFTLLSAGFLYTLINGGRDAGANGGDAVQAMIDTGIAPDSLVPGRPIRPAGVNSAAKAAAVAFKLRPDGSIPLTTFDEVVTAVVYGWQILFDVQAGGRYTTNSEGVIAYLGSWTNHEQQAGEGIKQLSDGSFGILGRNSWGVSWGGGGDAPPGFGYYTEQHFANSASIFALKYFSADPADPNSMPVFV